MLALEADDGELIASDEATIVVQATQGEEPTTIEPQVASASDDAEERGNGGIDLSSSDLELVYDFSNQVVGIRFQDVAIPPGATIVQAHVQFQVEEATSDATSLTIQGEARDDAATFSANSGNISSRPHMAAAVTWKPGAWTTVGDAGRVPSSKLPIWPRSFKRSSTAPDGAVAIPP